MTSGGTAAMDAHREDGGGPLVEMNGITKRFGTLVANADIDVAFRAGTVHGLLGENGAGKSTLMSILYGLQRADEGTVRVGSAVVDIRSPRDAIALEIGMVHQELMLVPNLTVVENVVAGTRGGPVLDLDEANKEIQRVAEGLGFRFDKPASLVRNLTVGEAQRIEIVKAVYRGARVLILDEPTSRLTPQEVHGLGQIVRKIRDSRGVVILVTHKLEEVLALCDHVTVLRGGRHVADVDVAELRATSTSPAADLARMMVGRPVLLDVERPPSAPGRVALQLKGVTSGVSDDARSLHDVSLTLHEGEVLGVAGVAGNGQRELAEMIIGLRHPDAGTIELFGRDITALPPWHRAEQGIGCIPDDRKNAGIVAALSVAENLTLRTLRKPPLRRWMLVAKRALFRLGAALIRDYDVRGANPRTPIAALSGGNQQKAILARELQAEPSVLLVLQPTAGLDVGAIEQVYQRLIAVRSKGVAVLLVSNELTEILSLGDRVSVMSRGRLTPPVPAAEIDLDWLGMEMAGISSARDTPGGDARDG